MQFPVKRFHVIQTAIAVDEPAPETGPFPIRQATPRFEFAQRHMHAAFLIYMITPLFFIVPPQWHRMARSGSPTGETEGRPLIRIL